MAHDFNLDNQWLPFTPNRAFRKDPRVFVAADGMEFTTHDGRTVVDGISSLWCVGAGHNRRSINDAIKTQLDTLDYATAFQVSNDRAFEAAARIAALAPGAARLNKRMLAGLRRGAVPDAATYDHAGAAEHREGIAAFIARRAPVF